MKGTLHEDQYTFLFISHAVLLGIKNNSYKSCRETRNKHFMFSNVFRKPFHLWGNVEE